jgi:ketosteroid isomerase-like protein
MANRSNRQIVTEAFAAWAAGTGYISGIFDPRMRWEIVGRSDVSKRYESTRQFVDEVLGPLGARFSSSSPFRPVNIRAIFADDEHNTVAVVWDGEGTTITGTTYRNTYAWFMTLEEGLVIDGTAFYDSIAFNELWRSVHPAWPPR